MKLPKDEKELEKFQADVDAMVNSFEEYKKQVTILSNQLDDALGVVASKQIAIDNLITIIKNIHIAVASENKDQIAEMMKEVGKFILSGEAIKSGVRQNAND